MNSKNFTAIPEYIHALQEDDRFGYPLTRNPLLDEEDVSLVDKWGYGELNFDDEDR